MWHVHAFWLPAYGPRAVWVGDSYHHPSERLRQHLAGYKSSRQVRNGRPALAEELYDHLPAFDHRYLAEDAADELAAELRADGYDVRADPGRLERIARACLAESPTLAGAFGAYGG